MHDMGMVDIHQHVVFGVDDGPKSIETSMEMLYAAYRQGVTDIIATSHAYPAMQQFPRERYLNNIRALQQASNEKQIPINIYFGCEVFYSEIAIEQLRNGFLPTLAGSNYVLVEFDPTTDLNGICNAIRKMANNGYRVVVAHCERYPALYNALDTVQRLSTDFKTEFQMNAGTIIKRLPWKVKRFRDKMLDGRLVDYVASDAHNCTSRAVHLNEAYEAVSKRCGQEYAWRVMSSNQLERILSY